jgi:hypothetical protein
VANGSPTFRAIHGCSATDVWAVGLQNFSVPPGIAYHWNGATWTASGPFLDHLNAVWCTSPSDVWAVGNYGRIAHWNGQAWTENPLDSITARAFYAVWASGPQDAWAAGLTFPGEETTLFHWDGISWTKATTGTSLTVSSLWGSGPADVWALAGNVVLHYDGTAWSEEPIGAAVALSQIWGSGSGDIWAVGEGGIIMHRQ